MNKSSKRVKSAKNVPFGVLAKKIHPTLLNHKFRNFALQKPFLAKKRIHLSGSATKIHT